MRLKALRTIRNSRLHRLGSVTKTGSPESNVIEREREFN